MAADKCIKYLGLRSIGKSGFRFWNPDFGFCNRTRNPSSGWISIKKSKSGFHWFPFHRSIGKSEKGFEKLFSWTAVFFLLIMRALARPLFLRTVFRLLARAWGWPYAFACLNVTTYCNSFSQTEEVWINETCLKAKIKASAWKTIRKTQYDNYEVFQIVCRISQ